MNDAFHDILTMFHSLGVPDQQSSGLLFSASQISNRSNDFIAKDNNGQPALLIAVQNLATGFYPPTISLEHLSVNHGLDCRIKRSDGIIERGIFSVIRLLEADRQLQEYFFRSILPVIQGLPVTPTYRDVSSAVNALAEIFRHLTSPSKKTIQGLWAELFLIASVHNPQVLIEAWHNTPEDIFDFSAGKERIEVKSSSGDLRYHHFSYEQLHPHGDISVLIASLFVNKISKGCNIFNLVDKIQERLGDESLLIQRVNQIVSATIGSGWRQAVDMNFDTEIAASSLAYYNHSSIPSVQSPLPQGITKVHFQADLSLCKPINILKIHDRGALFNALLF